MQRFKLQPFLAELFSEAELSVDISNTLQNNIDLYFVRQLSHMCNQNSFLGENQYKTIRGKKNRSYTAMPFCGSDLKKKCWKKSRIAQTLMETLDKRCCFICLARPYVGPWVVTSSHTPNPHHNPALMTQIKLATVPRNITAQLNFTLLAPLKLHREVLQHLVEMATTPKSVLVSGQSAEHFLVMRYPMSLPG